MSKFLALVFAGLLLVTLQCATAASPLWTQLPDMDRGCQFSSEAKVPSIVADDFVCPTETPTYLRWWGGLWTPTAAGKYGHYSDGRPTITALGNFQGWTIQIYDNVPQSATEPYARPGTALATWTLGSADVQETHYMNTQAGRHVHSYLTDLRNLNMPQLTTGSTYWLSIQAQMSDSTIQWGWHESNDHQLGTAVQDFKDAGWLQILNNEYNNDMAFELVIPEPAGLSILGAGLAGMASLFLRRRR